VDFQANNAIFADFLKKHCIFCVQLGYFLIFLKDFWIFFRAYFFHMGGPAVQA